MKKIKAMMMVAILLSNEETYNGMVELYCEEKGINPNEMIDDVEKHKEDFKDFVMKQVLETM